ncbi:DoxX family membrane protein [Corynebacterium timonense]|uniref:Uncharacterized membrane protein YphA, DoxX/SURF4 family n=1 Tax=Corynebacterium timonense TaxID=441500 RepID=A0A1H1PKM5_9CORY|nr:DoxX family membrane protein [Corynebacterium timonense]SDS11706.1 Uncharacterized membrane protein YphA, DoxX/SURF4 family [Corynebacterium timonense]
MIRKFARPMLASVYVADGVGILLNPSAHRDNAQTVLKKVRSAVPSNVRAFVPSDPNTAALTVGGVKAGAGTLFALGKLPRTSAALLAATAVPSLLGRNAFWEADDEQEKARRRTGALTDVALLGGVLIATVDTDGKPNLQWRAQNAAKQAKKNVQQALPTQSETESALSKAGDWISDRADQVTSYVDENKDDWKETASTLFQDAKEQTSNFVDKATDQAESLYKELQPEKKVNALVSNLQDTLDDIQPGPVDKLKAKRKVNKATSKFKGRAQDAVDTLQDAFDNLDAAPSKRQQRKWKKKAKQAEKDAQKAVKKAQKKLS